MRKPWTVYGRILPAYLGVSGIKGVECGSLWTVCVGILPEELEGAITSPTALECLPKIAETAHTPGKLL
jgi:hypothetical protein